MSTYALMQALKLALELRADFYRIGSQGIPTLTINYGGVASFALFNVHGSDDASVKEAAAVIKLSSSRMATQSECLGYEFAKWLGVQTPQARVIHNTSSEWLQIKEAAEKARDATSFERDAIGETTCSELLEALELSRCLLFMRYNSNLVFMYQGIQGIFLAKQCLDLDIKLSTGIFNTVQNGLDDAWSKRMEGVINLGR
ncbi:dual specificity protein phosphatase PHS1 [Trifolium repens]|nr:dual specificity protein phosphatase PHS1 [Trifolium repens]